MKSVWSCLAGCALAFSNLILAQGGTGAKPNLLIIMPDEWRRSALGFWSRPEYRDALKGKGDPVVTPNLDRFADEAIVFTQASPIHPVCSPARGMFLTGTYPAKNGLTANSRSGRDVYLKPEIPAFTDVLKKEGYNTAYFGKAHWIRPYPLFDAAGNYVGSQTAPGGHYANDFDTYIPPGPDRHGIEYFLQSIKDVHFDPYVYSSDPAAAGSRADGKVYRPRMFSTQYEADYLVQYLKNTRGQRDGGKPFCAIWTPNPPHLPYGSLDDVEPEVFDAHYRDKSVTSLLVRPNVESPVGNANVRYYFSNVTSVDKYIGEVLAALDQAGLKDNTLVLITSDHGEMMGSHGLMQKNVEFEEALGVPFLIRYPARLAPRIEDLLIGHVDALPTVLGLMGLAGKATGAQGTDFSRLLLDPRSTEPARPRASLFLGEPAGIRGIRTDRYTFVLDSTGRVRSLFDNVADPYQRTSLAFTSLSAADQFMLRQELGRALQRADDAWYRRGLLKDFVIYPASTATRPGLDSGFRLRRCSDRNIQVTVAEAGRYRIRVLDLQGKIRETLFAGEWAAGEHRASHPDRGHVGDLLFLEVAGPRGVERVALPPSLPNAL